jgi:hypothetical protein
VSAVALVVSLIAAVASGFAVWYTRRSTIANENLVAIERDRRAYELDAQEQVRAAIEAARLASQEARLELGVVAIRDGFRVIVCNRGPAAAQSIRVEPVEAVGGGMLPTLDDHDGPFDLEAGDQRHFDLFASIATPRRFVVELSWVDERGPQRKRRQLDTSAAAH